MLSSSTASERGLQHGFDAGRAPARAADEKKRTTMVSTPARSLLLRAAAVASASVAFGAAFALATPVALADTPPGWFQNGEAAPQPPPAGGDPQQPPAPPPQGQVMEEYADTDPSALTDFQEPLAPYGEWTEDSSYGTLWVPDAAQVGPDFAPYQSGGQWGVDPSGDWMWQSDYAWGYIPFHYGRWVWTGAYWGWIPGRRYAPAWVTWRVGEGGYVGWAPLPPSYGWRGGRAVGLGRAPYAAFCFVPTNFAFMRGVSQYVVRDRGAIAGIAAGTHPFRPGAGGDGVHAGRMSPSLSEAHVPNTASPRTASREDSRAMAYASRSSTAATQAGRDIPRMETSSYRGGGTYRGVENGSSYRGRTQSEGLRTPGVRSATVHSSSASYARGPHIASPSVSRPSFHAAPAASHSVSRGGGGRRR
jgi:hypothetical protein